MADHPAKDKESLPDWHPESPWNPWLGDVANDDDTGSR